MPLLTQSGRSVLNVKPQAGPRHLLRPLIWIKANHSLRMTYGVFAARNSSARQDDNGSGNDLHKLQVHRLNLVELHA